MVSYDVISLFKCILTVEVVETVRKRLLQDNNRTILSPDQICQMLHLCLNTNYFQYNGRFYKQKHGCPLGSPVSPTVASLYMKEVEGRALNFFRRTAQWHWFKYVDNIWVQIKIKEVQTYTENINSVTPCAVHNEEDSSLHIGLNQKPRNTDQY